MFFSCFLMNKQLILFGVVYYLSCIVKTISSVKGPGIIGCCTFQYRKHKFQKKQNIFI